LRVCTKQGVDAFYSAADARLNSQTTGVSETCRFVHDPHRRTIVDLVRLARVRLHEPVAGVTVKHEAVVGALAVGPESHGVSEVPVIYLALAGAVGQIDRQKVWVVAVVPAADGLPEFVAR